MDNFWQKLWQELWNSPELYPGHAEDLEEALMEDVLISVLRRQGYDVGTRQNSGHKKIAGKIKALLSEAKQKEKEANYAHK